MSDPYVEGLGRYMTAVSANPKRADESALDYAIRISNLVKAGGPVVTEGGLSFEDRCDGIYERQPGEDDE